MNHEAYALAAGLGAGALSLTMVLLGQPWWLCTVASGLGALIGMALLDLYGD